MAGKGWISIHRKMLDNPIVCKDSDHMAVWVYLLLNATHTEYPALFSGNKIMLQPGQLITGRKSIAEKLNISESKVQRILKSFESEQQIEQQNGNKNRLVTVVSWSDYQDSEQQDEQQVNNKRTTTEQQEFEKTSKSEQQIEQQTECANPCYDDDYEVSEGDGEHQNEQQLNNKNSQEIEKVNTNNNNNNVFNNNENKKDIYSSDYELFWNAYPRKVGKKVAWDKWKAVVKKEKPELIISCVKNYAAVCLSNKTASQYILHPSTFLNKERYKDYQNGGESHGGSTGVSKHQGNSGSGYGGSDRKITSLDQTSRVQEYSDEELAELI